MINDFTVIGDFLIDILYDLADLIIDNWLLSMSLALFLLSALVRFFKNIMGSKND